MRPLSNPLSVLVVAALLSASSLIAGFGASGPGTVLAAES